MTDRRSEHTLADYLSMGTMIGLGTALGLLVGMWMDNLILGMLMGSSAGVVIGAIVEQNRRPKVDE